MFAKNILNIQVLIIFFFKQSLEVIEKKKSEAFCYVNSLKSTDVVVDVQ